MIPWTPALCDFLVITSALTFCDWQMDGQTELDKKKQRETEDHLQCELRTLRNRRLIRKTETAIPYANYIRRRPIVLNTYILLARH